MWLLDVAYYHFLFCLDLFTITNDCVKACKTDWGCLISNSIHNDDKDKTKLKIPEKWNDKHSGAIFIPHSRD